MSETQRFDKYGRPIEDDDALMKDGDFVRVGLQFMDAQPPHDAQVGEAARNAYIRRLTGFEPHKAPEPVRDSQQGISDSEARRIAARDDYVQRTLGVVA